MKDRAASDSPVFDEQIRCAGGGAFMTASRTGNMIQI
jgi:hypothetical protein